MDNWYHQRIIDHYRNRRNAVPLINPMIRYVESNPLCGDSITVDITIDNGSIIACAFYGTGCVMSQASASLLSQEILSSSVERCMKLTSADLISLIGVSVGPVRMACVSLALKAAQKGIMQCLIAKRL